MEQLHPSVENDVGKKSSRSRKAFIDIARGIAMISIILGHLGVIPHIVYSFDVPIFFIISGFFIDEQGSLSQFIKRRFRTLIVPYLITSTIMILAVMIKEIATSGDPLTSGNYWLFAALYGSGANRYNPIPILGIGPIWFLLVSFFSCCLVKVLLKTKPYIRIPIIVLAFLCGYYTSKSIWLPFSIQASLCAALFVYIGYLIGQEKHLIQKMRKETKFVCFTIMACIWIAFIYSFTTFWFVSCDFGNGPIDIFSSVCGCLVVIVISYFIEHHMGIVSKFLSAVGKNSLLVLCVHTISFNLFPTRSLIHIPFLSAQACVIVMVIGEILMDIIIALVLSKIKIVRKAFGMKTDT